jgi:tetratricopeptide (TPR) repeat protein
MKLYDDSLIALMADHGEAFGEHGERGHGIFLYEPTIHVPLLFKMPAQKSAGQRIDSQAELVDVLPTVLEGVGVATPTPLQGHSLLRLMEPAAGSGATAQSKDLENQPAYAETDYPHRVFGWSVLRSLRTGKYLFVDAPRQELYDESADPGDDRNLASTSSAVSRTLAEQLAKFRQQTRSSNVAVAVDLDPQQEAKLRALGYTGSIHQESEMQVRGVDPKDKIELANEMTEVNFSMEAGHYEEAISKLKSLIARDPNIAVLYDVLGTAWIALGNIQNALPARRRAVELAPDSAWEHYQLGVALIQSRDFRAAATELEIAVAGLPLAPPPRYHLAQAYLQIDRVADAKKALETARELRPKYFEADVLLGHVFLFENNPTAAMACLREAIELQPNAPKPHQYMGEAYDQMGDEQNADRERALALQLLQESRDK